MQKLEFKAKIAAPRALAALGEPAEEDPGQGPGQTPATGAITRPF